MKLVLSLAALAVIAAAPVAPTVKPADPTAMFQGDVGRIIFNPACRDFDVASLPADPACAARVAAGETAPSLGVASRTMLLPIPRRIEALAVLDRAIAKENHPAAHYLLGSLLASGSLQPDYARAVRHLTIAAGRGNPAAADLLATLIVQGKGASRDIPRAVALYRQAIDGGFPSAAVALASLYLRGQYVPRDDAFGIALLQAAAAAGEPRAVQLAPMTAMIGKSQNFQLLPAADDSKVTAKSYSLFENPEIPSNFGYDDAFRAVHFAPFSNPAIRAGLERDAANRPTPYLYALARRLSDVDTGRAQTAYLLARMRMSYDAVRCTDPAAMEAISAWDGLIGPDLRFALEQLRSPGGIAAATAALTQEAALPADTRPWWVCRSGMVAMSAAMAGRPLPLALKPAADWPALRVQARAAIEKLAASAPQ